MSLESYNKTGMSDAYNVLKHLKKIKDKSLNDRKGGRKMDEEKTQQDPISGQEKVLNQTPVSDDMTEASQPDEDLDLAEPEEGDE